MVLTVTKLMDLAVATSFCRYGAQFMRGMQIQRANLRGRVMTIRRMTLTFPDLTYESTGVRASSLSFCSASIQDAVEQL